MAVIKLHTYADFREQGKDRKPGACKFALPWNAFLIYTHPSHSVEALLP